MKLEIKKQGINGEGIGYYNKLPVFVDRTLIDEVVDVSVIEDNKRYKIAKTNKIINQSDKRIDPKCKNYYKCDGCSLMHTTYDNQLEIKKSLLKEALLKYADIELDELEIVKSDNEFNYRNCLKLPFINTYQGLGLGIFKKDSNHICPINKCIIHSELLEEIKDKVLFILNKYELSAYDKKTKKGLRYLVLREIGKRAHMCLITGEDKIDEALVKELCDIKELVSIYHCINTSKNSVDIFSNKMIHLGLGKHLVFKIDDLKFNLSVKSFYQLNTNQAKKLYKYVVNNIGDGDLIVEAYAGIGAMSMLAKDKAKEIVGIEYIKDAVVNANVNANINKLNHIEFICGDSGEILEKKFSNRKIDTLIVDPPRSGLDDRMLDAILNSNIKQIIYISCNPATLAKNLAVLTDYYKIDSIKAFDMFPQTAHVESVTILSKAL